MAKSPANLSFEEAIGELQAIVQGMEQGDQSLEQSLKDFERGIALTKECQLKLQQAEQKIRILSEQNAQQELVDFDSQHQE